MNRGVRGRGRSRGVYPGREDAPGRSLESVDPTVVGGREKGVGHGSDIPSPDASQDKVVEETPPSVRANDGEGVGNLSEDGGVEEKKENGGEAEGAAGGAADEGYNQRGGRGDQRRGGPRGGFNKRGFGGGRGGRGKWGRGGGFGGNRWSVPKDPTAGIKRGDSDDPGTSKSSAEIIAYWTEADAPLLPQEPFEYTPFETPFNIEAREFLEDLRASREGLICDERGIPYDDCRMSHGYGMVCQFCDGRNGPWVHKDANPNDPAFKRYQESILRSPFEVAKTNEEVAQEYEERREVLKLGREADEVAEEEEPPVALGEDFGMFDRKLNLTE